jgi:rSAM/selenodomain-associated transferase 2
MDGVERSHVRTDRISVVVPVLHDSEALTHLLNDLERQTRTPDRIIIVSGARDEALAQLAAVRGFDLIETAASRGAQLDAGARACDSEILWFIHADARLPQEACEHVIAAIDKGAAGGCLRFTLQGDRDFGKRMLEWLVRLRIACGGMSYGDQALFCTQQAYSESGGFPHWPLFEEVPLVRWLQRQHRFVALTQPVFVAARRWERDGWLRRSLHNRWLALRFTLGAAPAKLAASYRRPQHTQQAPANPGSARQTHG